MSDSRDAARSQMLFEANRKSVGVAYLLWLFFGWLGGHRFYAGHTGSAVAQLMLSIVGWATAWLGVGFLLLAPLSIWLLVDAFLIPGWIRNRNTLLAMQLT